MVAKYYIGVCFVLLSASAFGVMPILANYAYAGGANVLTLLFLRFGLASVLFFVYMWIKKQLRGFRLTRNQWFALLLYGGATYALISILYFSSLHYISGSLATLLLYTSPIFVVLFSFLLDGSRVSALTGFAICLSLGGLGMVLGTSFTTIHVFGVILAIGSGLGYAIHIVLMNRVLKQLPPFLTTAFVILFTTVSLFIVGLSTRSFHFHIQSEAWISILILSFCSTILAILTFFLGLDRVGSTSASILGMFEPVVTILLSTFLLGESFTILQVMGTAVFLVAGMIVVKTQEQRHIHSHSLQAEL